MTAPLTIPNIVKMFDEYIDNQFLLFCNTDFKIVSNALEFCKNVIKYRGEPGVTLTDVLNFKPHEWYYGNFIEKLLALVFFPYTIHDGYQHRNFNRRLSTVQIHDLIWNMYHLVCVTGECAHNVINYYETTPLNELRQLCLDNYHADIPQDIHEYVFPIMFILRKGPSAVTTQQSFVKRWIIAKREQKRAAVRRIESWWLEIMLNPDHNIGQKTVERVAERFYNTAHAHDNIKVI